MLGGVCILTPAVTGLPFWLAALPVAGGSTLSVWGLAASVRARRLHMAFSDQGVTYQGLARSLNIAWSQVAWVGWIMTPATSMSPTIYSLAVGAAGHRVPYCLPFWVTSRTLGELGSVSESEVKHQLELALADRGIRYRERIPNVAPTTLWLWALAAAILIGFGPALAIILLRGSR